MIPRPQSRFRISLRLKPPFYHKVIPLIKLGRLFFWFQSQFKCESQLSPLNSWILFSRRHIYTNMHWRLILNELSGPVLDNSMTALTGQRTLWNIEQNMTGIDSAQLDFMVDSSFSWQTRPCRDAWVFRNTCKICPARYAALAQQTV